MEKCPSPKVLPTPCLCFRFKVSGELPLMHIKVSDQKIRNILDLVDSIPLPSVGSASHTPPDKVNVHGLSGQAAGLC